MRRPTMTLVLLTLAAVCAVAGAAIAAGVIHRPIEHAVGCIAAAVAFFLFAEITEVY